MSRVIPGSAKPDLSFSRYFPTLVIHKHDAAKYSLVCLSTALAIGSLFFFAGMRRSSIFISLTAYTGFSGLGLFHSFCWRLALPMTDGVERRTVDGRKKEMELSPVSTEGWRFTAVLAMGIAGSLFLLYELMGWADPVLSIVAACLFLLPFIIIQSWFTYLGIPAKKYKIWYNPVKSPDHTQMPGDISVKISVAGKYFDIKDTVFTIMARTRVRLGMLFCYFMLEQNKDGRAKIEWADEDNEPYGWEFYIPFPGGFANRRLDPDLTLGQNRIKNNDSIVAKRVKRKNIADPLLKIAALS